MRPTDVMTAEEVRMVLDDLRNGFPGPHTWLSLAAIRLALCGLRSCEICGLRMRDVILDGCSPAISIRKGITKGREGQRRARTVPLWWDTDAVPDLRPWAAYRAGAGQNDPFLVMVHPPYTGRPMTWHAIKERWKVATSRVLGKGRGRQLHIHAGRHTFISHALAVGRNPVEVMEAAGHASLTMTTEYAHRVDTGRQYPSLYSSSTGIERRSVFYHPASFVPIDNLSHLV